MIRAEIVVFQSSIFFWQKKQNN